MYFEEGNRLFEQANRARAAQRTELLQRSLEAYVDSLRIVRSRNALFNAAIVLGELGRNDEAFNYFGEYLAIEGLTAADRENATARRDALRSEVAVLQVSSEPEGALLWVDRKDLAPRGETPIELALPPGEHRAFVEKEGFEPVERTQTMVRGVTTMLSLALLPVAVAPVEPEPVPEPVAEPFASAASQCGHRDGGEHARSGRRRHWAFRPRADAARRLQPGRRTVHAHRRPGGLPARARPRRPDRPVQLGRGRALGDDDWPRYQRDCALRGAPQKAEAGSARRGGVGVSARWLRVDSGADWSAAMSRGLVALLVPLVLPWMALAGGCSWLNAPERNLTPPGTGGDGIELFCDDMLDDDNDLAFDCDDTDCAQEPACCELRRTTLSEDWTTANLGNDWIFTPTGGGAWGPLRPSMDGATFVGGFLPDDSPRALLSKDCVSLGLGGWVSTTLRTTDATGCTARRGVRTLRRPGADGGR